jgi:Uma2 family endonuclease
MGEPTTLSPMTDRSAFSLHPEDWVTQRVSHDNQTAYLKHGLRFLLPHCFVAHDLAVYWVPGQMQFPYIGPDNFVSRHQPREEDPTVWLTYEDGPLALVIEVASEATRDKEEEKRKIYAEVLKVPEYVSLDLHQGELRLGRLVGGQYEWVEPDAEGRLWSEQFKVGFVWEEGERFVRLVAADGTIVAAPLEEVARREEAERRQRAAEEQAAREARRAARAVRRAEQETARAARETRRAEQEAARAEQEAARAEQEAARAEQEAARAEQEAAQRAAAEQQARELAAEVERLRRLLEESGRPGNGAPAP